MASYVSALRAPVYGRPPRGPAGTGARGDGVCFSFVRPLVHCRRCPVCRIQGAFSYLVTGGPRRGVSRPGCVQFHGPGRRPERVAVTVCRVAFPPTDARRLSNKKATVSDKLATFAPIPCWDSSLRAAPASADLPSVVGRDVLFLFFGEEWPWVVGARWREYRNGRGREGLVIPPARCVSVCSPWAATSRPEPRPWRAGPRARAVLARLT